MADFRPGSVSWELPNGISMHMWINTHTTHGQILQLSGTRGYMTGITPSSARTTHFVGQWGALDICRIHARTSSHMKQQGERKKLSHTGQLKNNNCWLASSQWLRVSGRLFVEQSFFVQIYNLLFNLFYC